MTADERTLATTLLDTAQALQRHIEERADLLAAARLTELEVRHTEQLADLRVALDVERRRREDLTQEFRRQIAVLEKRANSGYVTGVYAVEQWLNLYSFERRGLDERTSRLLAAGARGMMAAAVERLGVNPNGCVSTDWPAADAAWRAEAAK